LGRGRAVGGGGAVGAISNAVFDATGIPLRSVPYTPAKVKAALSSA
jgi:CO/xanthine dehydrogenase Mo-binding subunit